jgi:hypothetical protein
MPLLAVALQRVNTFLEFFSSKDLTTDIPDKARWLCYSALAIISVRSTYSRGLDVADSVRAAW